MMSVTYVWLIKWYLKVGYDRVSYTDSVKALQEFRPESHYIQKPIGNGELVQIVHIIILNSVSLDQILYIFTGL